MLSRQRPRRKKSDQAVPVRTIGVFESTASAFVRGCRVRRGAAAENVKTKQNPMIAFEIDVTYVL